MSEKFRNYSVTIILSLFIIIFLFLSIIMPDKEISLTERRELEQFPKISHENILNGSFSEKFEKYTLDQFPMRENFRFIKSTFSFYAMQKTENNGIYIADGYASKLEYPLNNKSLTYATDRIKYVYKKYFSESNSKLYYSIIPDKNYFLAEQNNYPLMNYTELVNTVKAELSFGNYIDIFPKLEINDYYRTDTHWRQEKIGDVAEYIANQMIIPYSDNYTVKELDTPFYGVYYGQIALPMKPDKLCIIEKSSFDKLKIFDYETKAEIGIYDMQKVNGADAYEMYLSGSKSLITIDNPSSLSDRELVIFRDSFGSSLIPYFADSYKKIIIIDIRYIAPDYLGKFVKFNNNSDVLFIYSTLVLNNSITIK